jgi:hypothetical protein
MPYIKPEDRELLVTRLWNNEVEIGVTAMPDTPGELNYCITELIRSYYNNKPGYQSINDIVGALEGAKLEFYRRVAAPYEDQKIKENGDVY